MGVVDCVDFKVGLVRPHLEHCSTLCLDDVLFVESFKIGKECEDEKQKSYILNFAQDKQRKTHLTSRPGGLSCIINYSIP